MKIRRCVSAGEALPAEVGRRWSERYGVEILDGIGSTEMLHIFLSNRAGEVKYGTTGKPVPGYDVRLVDDDGAIVKSRGEMGELQVRGPDQRDHVLEQPRAVAHDVSRANGRARATNTSRMRTAITFTAAARDDMLKVSGMYVSPFEVEAALQSHPDVLEAAVVGWPDDDTLIKPKAFVVLKSPEKAGDDLARTLQDHCRTKLAPVQISALARIPQRAAENRDRQNPALQAAGRGGGEVTISRARRSTKRSAVMRCRTGIVINSECGTIPDQRCIVSRCIASGRRRHGRRCLALIVGGYYYDAIPSARRGSSAGRAPHS